MDYANDLILQTTRSETATSHASTSTEHATVILVTHNNEEDSSDGAEADNEMESLERKPTNGNVIGDCGYVVRGGAFR